MADVKWIKILTDIFDDEKILLIETLPEADSIIVIWFKILCLAGKQNNSGVFVMNERMPYNEKMFATIFRRKESTVQLALKTFEEFGMIEIIDGAVTIPNWGKHQNLESMERRKEYMKEYMREYRAKQAQLLPRPADESEESSVSWSDLKEAFNNECAYCGKSQDVAGPLQQEHIIPFNCDGEYTLGNIIPACKSCNTSKGKKNMSEWYAQQCFFDKERLNKIIEYTEGPEDFVRKRLRKHLRKQDVSTADKNRLDKNRLDKSTVHSDKPNDDGFNTFWAAYPRKVGKKTAQAAWAKIKNPDIDLILDAISKQKKTIQWTKEKGSFIPHPTTWLNQERWNDEVDIEVKKLSAEGREVHDYKIPY